MPFGPGTISSGSLIRSSGMMVGVSVARLA
jgi:hypothetical protein